MLNLAKRSGGVQAAWAIADSGGKAKVIQFVNDEQALTVNMGAGFAEMIKKCSECELVEEVPFLLADLGAPLTQKANSALLKAPNADYAMAPYDPAAAPVAQAVNSAGKTNSVKVLGAIGAPYSIELIRAGRGQSMATGWDVVWMGWAAMDDVVRIKAGEEPVYSGWALGIVDKDNLPKTDQYHGPVDYEANYEKIWSAGAAG
jgi:ribose transport system substrate-binding protein